MKVKIANFYLSLDTNFLLNNENFKGRKTTIEFFSWKLLGMVISKKITDKDKVDYEQKLPKSEMLEQDAKLHHSFKAIVMCTTKKQVCFKLKILVVTILMHEVY